MNLDTPPPPDTPSTPPTEPSVLDWIKSILRGKPVAIPEQAAELPISLRTPESVSIEAPPIGWPEEGSILGAARLRLPVALLLAFIAQFGLENRGGSVWVSIGLYLVAGIIVGWAVWSGDFSFQRPTLEEKPVGPLRFKLSYMLVAVFFSILTFIASSNNVFRLPTVVFWFVALLALVLSLWEGPLPFESWMDKIRDWLRDPRLAISLNTWALAVLLGFGISVYFRIAQLETIPAEMVSDHAEKLLDVGDVLDGRYSIFFPRNTGREALQFYMAAVTANLLGTGLTFMTLKIGTVLAGILTLPYIYLLGKEVGGKTVGLAAMVLAGVGYWPNVISRVGLRFPLYPVFVAPALYFLAKGLRRRSRNDFLICGLIVGVGLHGYSPSRVIPIAVALGVGVYLLHRIARGQRWALFTFLVGAGLVALVVLLPLLRVALERPDDIIFRMVTRMGDAERPLPGPALLIFGENVLKALAMFGWDDGEVWVNSIPHRPALDWVTGGLFHLGIVILFVRYLRHKNWLDLFLLLSIPVLQLPSSLSLAFPGENPATNRAAGAIIPAFIAAGIALAAIPAWVQAQWQSERSRRVGVGIVMGLFLLTSAANYNLVFHEYKSLYLRSAWNTSQAGAIVQSFAQSIGDYETAHVVAYPHWFDTRLVGINAGNPRKDYAISVEAFEGLLTEERAQLFILHREDEAGLNSLRYYFPEGDLTTVTSPYEGKDFLTYVVLARTPNTSQPANEPEP